MLAVTNLTHAAGGAVTTLGDLPLDVLTAPVDAQTGWLTAQMDLAALSGNCIHLVVAGAGHASMLDNQSDAAVSGHAIVRSSTPSGSEHG